MTGQEGSWYLTKQNSLAHDHDEVRERINADIADFHAKGGQVTQVETGVSGMRQIQLEQRNGKVGYVDEYDRKSFNAGDRRKK